MKCRCRLFLLPALLLLVSARLGGAHADIEELETETLSVKERCLLQVAQSKGRDSAPQHHARRSGEDWHCCGSDPQGVVSATSVHESGSSVEKVLIEIYYQFQCPHCVELLSTDLKKVWEDEDFKKAVEVKLYPEYFPMMCCLEGDDACLGSHLGENGCLGSRVELCAIDIWKDSSKYVPFVLCLSSHGHNVSVELSSQNCSKELGVDMAEITSCVNSRQGFDLMVSAANKSAEVDSPHIPWVVINGQHAENDDLIPAVCQLLKSPLPTLCSADIGQATKLHKGKSKRKKGCSKKHPCYYFVDAESVT